ncbi:MAG TPA: MOSC domain-containing protein [Segeticoccus sp.]|uniref:MOSC domain-containing protein n=1 Tax=Segeticoccus sp. TaxID=2706531 RepID=UPI002D7FA7AE|nr:MOSC domain-containing protein [Segeticoccus sp.]HET8600431.1 MOSC domain-containing protein [Segeticoccus sp.]
MIEVELPTGGGAPVLVRSFAACLAAATETPVAGIPLPAEELPAALEQWRSWLAARGAGLVAIDRPAGFNWPGYWLAVLEGSASTTNEGTAVLMFGTPSGVVLSPQDPSLLGRASSDLPVRQGYVVAQLDPASSGGSPDRPRLRGRVELIALAGEATADMYTVGEAQALTGRGLEGDRYAKKAGTFTPKDPTRRGYDLTLVEAEVLDALSLPEGDLGYAQARRNLVTRGIDLNALVGRRFRVGEVECVGQRLCEPCAHLERLTVKGALRALIHRGGLRADVLSDGRITNGTEIETLD